MKIGILTFHWAANYGGVLQAYALQEYLISKGHIVEIIDYKPFIYEYPLKYIVRPQLLLNAKSELNLYRKERKLRTFREQYLNLSKHYYKQSLLENEQLNYDVLISGSDQVLNPSFLLRGEFAPSSAYFLDFQCSSIKIGYAVSFGCTEYPIKALTLARSAINNFTKIGVRERSGFSLLDQMHYKLSKEVVPDPTILLGKHLFDKINIKRVCEGDYYCMYVLRKQLSCSLPNLVIMDEAHKPMFMEEWIGAIAYSKGLVTNSYHGMIMAILNHVPFVAILETKKASGMNDRFYTLLTRIGLECRIVNESDDWASLLKKNIDWADVDKRLDEYRGVGKKFLKLSK